MQKNKDKRLTKAISELDTKSRVLAILEAVRNDDDSLIAELKATAPRKTYTCIDGAESESVEACVAMSLILDRAYFMNLTERNKFRWYGCKSKVLSDKEEREQEIKLARVIANQQEDELRTTIAAFRQMADLVGIPFEGMLAWSLAMKHDEFEALSKPDGIDPEGLEFLVSMLKDTWSKHKNAAFQPTEQSAA